MPHNIMLLDVGKADEIGLQAIALGARGFDVGFVPESADILWHSQLVNHGQEEVIEFTAPAVEGAYPYICSFPGHHRLMRGTLFVTENLKDFLVKNPQTVTKVTEWKLSDFSEDLKRVAQHRNFAEGKQLFSTLGCAQCHHLSKLDISGTVSTAGSLNQSVGPNIDDTTKKHKGDAKAVLLEILEPARNIEDKYRQTILALEDGSTVIGIILAEDAGKLKILTGTPPKEHEIPTKNVDSRRASPFSIMPNGLLNTVDKEQILDLLAYLLAGGNAEDAAFKHKH
jgi:putative heme-binding domain-containing protein